MFDSLTEILRCPHCAPRGKEGLLAVGGGTWLICQEPGCGQKYPVHNGLPTMLTEEGDYYHYRKGLEPADLRVHKHD